MTAGDIYNFALPFIDAAGPVIFVLAIVANAGALVDLLYRLFNGDR